MYKLHPMLKRLVLSLLVLWAGAGLLMEIHKALAEWDGREDQQPAWSLRLGGQQVTRLERCLARARQIIPPGSVVAFISPDEPKGVAFFRSRWAAYLMPAHHLVQPDDPSARGRAEYLIAFDLQAKEPGLERIRRLPGGRLYRVRRP